jgi:hypothetical protein
MYRVASLIALALASSLCVAAQPGNTAAIQERLNAQFKITTTTTDRSDIVTAGDVVVIHKPGMIMYAVNSPMAPSNSYKNGKIGQGWGGFGKDMLITMAAPGGATSNDYPHRQFVPEEKCWVTGIQAQKDGVLIQLYSDPYDNLRYYGNVKIPFPNKKEIPSADAAIQLVAEVLTVAPADNQGGPPTGPGATPPPIQPPPPDTPPQSTMQPIAPPPPPADAPPPTIALGQTMDQVAAGFGQPLKVAKLGVKTIFYYKDMKVTFTNGKVSNVE